MIICIAGLKGGSSKTTVSINLSHAIAKPGHKVLLIDADPQASTLLWSRMREETPFDILHKADNRIHRDIKDITKGYNHCLIDCPPRGQDITLSALLASRLCVIPVRPSPLDIWSGREFLEVIAEARKHNKGLQAKLLIAQKVAGTIPAKEIREALQTLKRGIFNTEIGFRVAYVKAMTEGKTILEYERNGAAAMEITNLRDEILKRG